MSSIPNKDLYEIPPEEWREIKIKIKKILKEFLSVKGIGLAKTTKILHLKRPNLFPVLDSFVIKFLLNINISEIDKPRQIDVGLKTLEIIRETITKRAEFQELVKRTGNLPIPLTAVRIFDILCWTTEKWDVQRNLNAPYGIPQKSLLHKR